MPKKQDNSLEEKQEISTTRFTDSEVLNKKHKIENGRELRENRKLHFKIEHDQRK